MPFTPFLPSAVATQSLEIFVGADRIVRINVDGLCIHRIKLAPGAALLVQDAVALATQQESPIQ